MASVSQRHITHRYISTQSSPSFLLFDLSEAQTLLSFSLGSVNSMSVQQSCCHAHHLCELTEKSEGSRASLGKHCRAENNLEGGCWSCTAPWFIWLVGGLLLGWFLFSDTEPHCVVLLACTAKQTRQPVTGACPPACPPAPASLVLELKLRPPSLAPLGFV